MKSNLNFFGQSVRTTISISLIAATPLPPFLDPLLEKDQVASTFPNECVNSTALEWSETKSQHSPLTGSAWVCGWGKKGLHHCHFSPFRCGLAELVPSAPSFLHLLPYNGTRGQLWQSKTGKGRSGYGELNQLPSGHTHAVVFFKLTRTPQALI